MGKWLSRVIEKGESGRENFQDSLKNNTDNVDIVGDGGASPFDHEFVKIPRLDLLTDCEREAYQGWYNVMVGPKFKMPHEAATNKAWELLIDSMKILQVRQVEKDLRLDGYSKIYSTKQGEPFYICRDESAKKRVPDKSISVFTMDEIENLQGLDREYQLLLVEAKTIFNGVIQNEKG